MKQTKHAVLIKGKDNTIMKNKINVKTALNNSLDYAKLTRNEVRVKETEHEKEMYYAAFATDWLNYECYIDDVSGEVLGINYYPTSEDERREHLVSGKAFKFRHLLAATI